MGFLSIRLFYHVNSLTSLSRIEVPTEIESKKKKLKTFGSGIS